MEVRIPSYVYIQRNAINKLGRVLERVDSQNAVMLTDGIVKEIVAKKIDKIPFSGTFIVEKASILEAREIVMNLGYGDVDTVVGIGGGKVLDVSKVVATELNAEFISVPTTASHDGIASPVASFKENGKPVSISTKPPIAVIADTEIIKSCPKRLIHSGFGDLISNITAVKDWRLSRDLTGESYNEVAVAIASMPAHLMLNKAIEPDFRLESDIETLLRGLIMSGVAIAIAGSSRPASGAEHKFSHALDYLGYGNGTHGEQVGLGTIIFEYFYEKAYNDGDWNRVREGLRNVGAPTKAREIGLTGEQMIEALVYAKRIRRKRFTILEAIDPSKEEFENALKQTEIVF
ncbi:MAG: sn-glycerol-1-phosphate dehydrogenase [Archaeoglobaceae archaeon]|nr:sn-glycerol-1-phosphate dehydrogenase [Archaeoglobaceae archaeon]MDW8118756.1 sn-glycerol-1-phosphate dehydrogenase [Archaeoglobaceae archaeon]